MGQLNLGVRLWGETTLLVYLLCSAGVTLQSPVSESSCPSLAYLQPSLAFSTGDASPGLSLPGLLLGPLSSNTSEAGISQAQQRAVAFLNSALPVAGHQLLARVGAASSATGAIMLPGSVQLAVKP